MMATTYTNTGPAVDSAFEQFKDSSEQFATTARKAGNLYLDSYEKVVDRALDLEVRIAELSQQEWLQNLIETQAKLARELADSYTSAARSLLK
jgi:hypothetical protein